MNMNLFGESYVLMYKEHKVFEFTISDSGTNIVYLDGQTVYNDYYIPIGITNLDTGTIVNELFVEWLRSRMLRVSRVYFKHIIRILRIDNLLKKYIATNGLSLSDSYWFQKTSDSLEWFSLNYHDVIQKTESGTDVFLYGNGSSSSVKSMGHAIHMNFVSDGRLPKRWEFFDGKYHLVKGSSRCFMEQESVNEIIATIIAKHLGFMHLPYIVEKRQNKLYSICECVTSNQLEYVPAISIIRNSRKISNRDIYKYYVDWCQSHGLDDIESMLSEMVILDYLMLNTDRHFGNFGVLRNTNTLLIEGIMPLFDNGTSLNCDVPNEHLLSINDLVPLGFYGSFETMLEYITDSNKFEKAKNQKSILEEIRAFLLGIRYNASRREQMLQLLGMRFNRLREFNLKVYES